MSNKKTKFRLKVIAGNHVDGSVTHEAGSVFDTDKPLHKIFSNKFEVVTETPVTPLQVSRTPSTPETAPELLPDPVPVDPGEDGTDPDIGEDVSDQFPVIDGQGVVVYKVGKEFQVYEADEPADVVNGEPLKTKKAVVEFLTDYLA